MTEGGRFPRLFCPLLLCNRQSACGGLARDSSRGKAGKRHLHSAAHCHKNEDIHHVLGHSSPPRPLCLVLSTAVLLVSIELSVSPMPSATAVETVASGLRRPLHHMALPSLSRPSVLSGVALGPSSEHVLLLGLRLALSSFQTRSDHGKSILVVSPRLLAQEKV